jgi:O-antigen/teichoic acid export membrane protein
MKYVNYKYAPDLFKLGARFFILRISSIVLYTSSNIIITQILGPEEVTVYNIAYKYFYVPIMVFSIVMTPVWSAVTDAYVKDDFVWLKNILKKLNLISLIFVSGILVMLLMSGTVYRLWIGDRVEVPFILSAVMALYAIINVTLSPYSQFINGFGKLKISTVFVWFQVILFIPLAIYLTKSPLGVTGIMLATCLITGTAFMIEPVQTHKLLNKKANGIWNK